MAPAIPKTNVMRILDGLCIPYQAHSYAHTKAISAEEVALALNRAPDTLFKTLVVQGKSGKHYVCMVPGHGTLSLKKAAALTGEKAVQMLPASQLLSITGYVHGGCSPIGMRKPFPTFLHQSAQALPTFLVSAGKIGYQVELSLEALAKAIPLHTADLLEE